MGNRKWTQRDRANGDVFGYDLNDQVTAVKLDIANPDTTSVGSQTIHYDANGNRTTFSAYGPTTDTYTTNNLNQYSSTNAVYNFNGDMTTGVDGSTYTYDAQNRLLTAAKNGVTETFKYDGLNRQVSRKIGTGAPTYNVYDGWDLIQEYQAGGAVTVSYFHGAGGLVKNIGTGGINRYYYQDASGSTSHLADSTGHLLEWYRYDLQGTPIFYNASNTQISASSYGVRHLFTGQQWYSELGLYDLRNRYYSPDIGRFLQADPIGFGGDATNLYRYCGNNPLIRSDPTGETVYISEHLVVWPGNHTYLTIDPSDPGSFTGTSNFGPSGTLTISGQPIGGYLNRTFNTDTPAYTTVVQPPAGMTAAEFDNAVYNAAASYPNDTYAYFPVPEFGVDPVDYYNSNGFTVEILIAAGVINAKGIVDSLPGWQPGTGIRPGQAPFDHVKLDIRNFGGGGLGGFGGSLDGNSLGNFGGFGTGVSITTGSEFQGLVGPGRVLLGQESDDFTGGGGLGFPPSDWTPDGPVKKEF